MSPVDVKEFRTDILEAGTRLASLLTVEYPNADLVSAALYNVLEFVDDFSTEGKLYCVQLHICLGIKFYHEQTKGGQSRGEVFVSC